MSETKTINQTITLENRKHMMLTGISEVVSQIDKAIIARAGQSHINISGDGLRVTKLNLEEGTLIVEGNIDGFKYVEKSDKGFFKRIFK